ncbi:MAG: hypothetical protein EOS23_31885, partial [Mesorhizobium sp.]|uniref:hypothetical protein n=1 Tax=Mesorhizobium sp. TaxID=1871066 RepID=UPI000FE8565B
MSFDGSQQGFAMAPQALGCAKKKQKGQPEDCPFAIDLIGNAGVDYSLMVTTMPAPTVRPPSR